MNTRIALLLLAAIAAPALAQPATELQGTLKKVKDNGSITLGIRESSYPLSYLDDKQQPVGYHIDVCNRIVDAVKAQLKLPALKVQHQAVTSQNRIPLVSNGTVDLECGSTTNNEARQKQVAFAPTTFVTNVRMAVKKASGIQSLGQLGGKPVATTTGTTSVQLMRAHEKGKGIDFKEVYGKDHADAFLMLETDRAVAFVMDDNLLAGRLRHRRRGAQHRADRHHAAQGRSRIQKAGRCSSHRPHEKRRTRQALRALVHVADSAQERQHEFPDERAAQAADQGAERRAGRELQQEVRVGAGGTATSWHTRDELPLELGHLP